MASLEIKGKILTPSSGEEYTKAIGRISDFSVLHPKYVVFPAVFEDIPHIIKYTTSQSLEIAVKGGGASSNTWSSTDGGLVIDLGLLKAIHVADDKKTVTVQGGAIWTDVYEACKKAEIDVVGAPFGFVGVGGFLLGAGVSHMSGEYGYAIDNVLGATVVLADGRIVKTSATEEPDLFWAIRGTVLQFAFFPNSLFNLGYAGGFNQFGVVVEFVLKAYPPQGPFSTGVLVYPGSEVENVINTFNVSGLCSGLHWAHLV
jgi:FAD/FMN-containing dehydrogenase